MSRQLSPAALCLVAGALALVIGLSASALQLGPGWAFPAALILAALLAWRWGWLPSLIAIGAVTVLQLWFAPPTSLGDAATLPGRLLATGSISVVAVLIAWLVAARRDEAQHLAQLAFYDPLTSLPNRALFTDRLTQAMARSRRHGGTLALLYLDLDDFKRVNDRFGHASGDALLAVVGERLRNVVGGSDTVARLGGDEFAVLLEDIKNAASARLVAQRLIDVLRYPILFRGDRLECTPSIGISYGAAGLPTPEELLHHADAALYRAKRENKGWFCDSAEDSIAPSRSAL